MKKYLDGKGIAFTDYRSHLPKRAADFPKAGIIRDKALLAAVAEERVRCAVCGRAPPDVKLETHHIMGGATRSDERTNLIVLCGPSVDSGTCHGEAHGGGLTLGHILWVKWLTDQWDVDWVRLAILRRSFLPDLKPIPEPLIWYRELPGGRND